MDRKKRCEILRAMDLIARTLNNDPLYTEWMIEAVIDEDMTDQTTDKDLEGYVKNDDEFAGILYTFLHVMSEAFQQDGLTVDGVASAFYDNYR